MNYLHTRILNPLSVIGRGRNLKSALNKLYEYMEEERLKKETVFYDERTSISDDGIYPVFCALAAREKRTFATFRAIPIYNVICGNVPYELAESYIQVIEILNDEPSSDRARYFWQFFFKEAIKNDLYGNPLRDKFLIRHNSFNKYVRMSATTVYHCKVLNDLIYMFNKKDMQEIVEIGVGFGGLCRLIATYFDYKRSKSRYVLVDLAPVLNLTKRYLDKYNLDTYLEFIDGKNITSYEGDIPDFFISNYAFSELSRNVQDVYFESIINKTKCGYMICNDLANKDADLKGYSVEEIANRIPESRIINFYPRHHKVIVWGYCRIPELYL